MFPIGRPTVHRHSWVPILAILFAACTTAGGSPAPSTTTTSSSTSSTTTSTLPPTTTTLPPVTTTTRPAPPVTVSSSCAAAEAALRTVGATDSEIQFALPIAQRESNCTLQVVADRPSTGDYSWGPWQINYYGTLYAGRVALLGTPDTNTASWESAATNFLTLLRVSGACHWQPPSYCS
jgi:hypothetical protein